MNKIKTNPLALFTDQSNIRLGFEVECYVKGKHETDFRREIAALNREIAFSDDPSIELPDSYQYDDGSWGNQDLEGVTFELQTPVLPPKSAMKLLFSMFAVLQKYGGTNQSCGLHLNISSTDKTRMKNFDPFPFAHSTMWPKLLKDFRRDNNDFCNHNYNPKETPMEYFERLSNGYDDDDLTDKYNCVNLCNWSGGDKTHSRVEIRGMGNDKYHYRITTVAKYVSRIIKLFVISCERRAVRV